MTLTEFLLARIAEDEAIANETRPDEYIDPEWDTDSRDASGIWCADARDPAFIAITSGRVLAECEAKRRIIESTRLDGTGPSAVDWWIDQQRKWTMEHELQVPQHVSAFTLVLRLLAQPYADHADYDATWHVT